MFRLDGKTALVTGASGGIGAAIARALHAQGAAVALSGTRRDALEALAADLGERAHVCPADLRDPAAPTRWSRPPKPPRGRCYSGQQCRAHPRHAGAAHEGRGLAAVLDVDLTAPFRLARAALKGMLRRRAGRIIQISSVVGSHRQSGPGQLCRRQGGACRHEQGAGAGSRQPRHHRERGGAGLCRDADDRRAERGAKDPLSEAIPLGRMGQPEDVAAAVAYLASDEAAWVTGATLHVNGGMAML